MADLTGLMSGIGSLGQGFLQGYQAERKFQEDRRQSSLDKALKDKMLKMQMLQQGLQETPDGGLSLTPQAQEKEQLGLLKTKAEIGKLTKPDEDRALDREYKQAQIQKIRGDFAKEKAPTADMYKASGFATRSEQADAIINDIGNERATYKSALKSTVLPTGLLSPNLQKIEQAERNFTNAVLRRESGASITKEEFNNAALQYFPRGGDSDEVLAQKAQNRAQVIQNLKSEGGSATGKIPQAPLKDSKPQLTREEKIKLLKGG